MPLQLEIVSEHKELVGEDSKREFREEGGTIGRSLHNDWILPDPDRYISGKHAAIDCRGGIYYLADLSSNGVYVNNENAPIGKGNSRRLFNGDVLHLGDFRIEVSIDEGETLSIPDDPDDRLSHDNVPQMATVVSPLSGVEMLDEEEITGDDDFRHALFGKPDETPNAPNDVPDVLDVGAPQLTPEGLFSAFLEGLNVERSDLPPNVDLKDVFRRAGQVLREYVSGSEELLSSRTHMKTAFKLEQTTVLPKDNNPLKLSENTDDSIKQLLIGEEGGEYLGPRDAVREINRDLLVHQEAFIDAMSVAFADYADRFDPEELIQSFDQAVSRKPRLKLLSEQKYWQLYKDLYPILTETGGGRFPHMLAEEFIRAYERYVADANRPNVDKTQKLDVKPKMPKKPADEFDPEISAELEALPDPEERSA